MATLQYLAQHGDPILSRPKYRRWNPLSGEVENLLPGDKKGTYSSIHNNSARCGQRDISLSIAKLRSRSATTATALGGRSDSGNTSGVLLSILGTRTGGGGGGTDNLSVAGTIPQSIDESLIVEDFTAVIVSADFHGQIRVFRKDINAPRDKLTPLSFACAANAPSNSNSSDAIVQAASYKQQQLQDARGLQRRDSSTFKSSVGSSDRFLTPADNGRISSAASATNCSRNIDPHAVAAAGPAECGNDKPSARHSLAPRSLAKRLFNKVGRSRSSRGTQSKDSRLQSQTRARSLSLASTSTQDMTGTASNDGGAGDGQ
ncbi:hypothetical protein EV182_007068, partial [Spiromyces aspiralis]